MTFYLDQVAEFAATTKFEDLPAPVIERTKYVIADCIAAIVGGSVESPNGVWCRFQIA